MLSYGSTGHEFGADAWQLIIRASPPRGTSPRTISSRRLLSAFFVLPEPWRAWPAAVGLRRDLLRRLPADIRRGRWHGRGGLRGDSVPFSADAQEALAAAAEDAAARGSETVDLAHVLLALLWQPAVTEMFHSQDDVAALREAVARGFSEPGPES